MLLPQHVKGRGLLGEGKISLSLGEIREALHETWY
jgi:hypothetical protein